jgi:hypothetical protein
MAMGYAEESDGWCCVAPTLNRQAPRFFALARRHRARAARLAIVRRCAAVSRCARAWPPFRATEMRNFLTAGGVRMVLVYLDASCLASIE